MIKVVSEDEGRYWSCRARASQVEYSTEKWSVAPEAADKLGYGLLVFDTIENAITFSLATGGSSDRFFECEVRGIIANPPRLVATAPFPWSPRFDPESPDSRSRWTPKGTIMVTAVKLLWEINQKEAHHAPSL